MHGNKNIYTVTQISKIIRKTVEESPHLSSVLIKGELSNVTYHSSGHIYCTLKDDGAIINAAFFKYANRSLKIRLEEGMSIIAEGNISVYEKRGSYQLIIKSIVPDGIGQLQLRIEQLKQSLTAEGLFDSSRKKILPRLPRRIGVVTSPTGAAYRDILKVLLRRFPNVEVLLAPAKVQGDNAAETIALAIRELNNPRWDIDLIIAGRGGGSFEDLMPFNEEIVVRAFAESRLPVISAVGHQIDHPLCDDAADMYAPTPSAAAEIAVPLKSDLEDEIHYLRRSLDSYLDRMREHYRQRYETVLSRRLFTDPMQLVARSQMRLDEQSVLINHAITQQLYRYKNRYSEMPDLTSRIRTSVREKHFAFKLALESIEKLSPMKILLRGFAVVRDTGGAVVKSVDSIKTEDTIRVFLHDGHASCNVKSVIKENIIGKEE